MKENTNSDAGSDNTLVNVTKLTAFQQKELSQYTLSLINSARHQLGKHGWTYKQGALRFANRVANENTTAITDLAVMPTTMLLELNAQLRLLALTQK